MHLNASILVLCSFILAGCVGPLLNHETGRTLGKDNHDIKVISTIEGYYGLKYTIGITDDFDIGFGFESLSMGVSGKYSFINNDQGLSVATNFGLGTTWGGTYLWGGAVASYLANGWEPFASLRYTNVSIAESDIEDDNTGEVFVTIPESSYSYAQVFLGTKYWFTKGFALSGEASYLFGTGSGVEFDSDIITSLGLEFKF